MYYSGIYVLRSYNMNTRDLPDIRICSPSDLQPLGLVTYVYQANLSHPCYIHFFYMTFQGKTGLVRTW